LLVFIDESGDPGFKISKGSSPIFVTSMVIFEDSDSAASAQTAILQLQKALRIQPEFKFNKCCDDYKAEFFGVVGRHKFTTRSVVVQKELIYSEALRTVKESFYKFFIRQMMENDGGVLHDAKIVIDGSGDREFKRQFAAYLRKHLRPGCMRDLQLKDSQKDSLIQLADMTAGAVARSYRKDRKDAAKWRGMLAEGGKLGNVWEFK
jgi:hypothetical protein